MRVDPWPIALHLALVSLREAPCIPGRPHKRSPAPNASWPITWSPRCWNACPTASGTLSSGCRCWTGSTSASAATCSGLKLPSSQIHLLRHRLFVTSAEDAPGVMRYHALSRLLLQQELRFRDPIGHEALHRRAAELWAERGDLHIADRHLVAVGDQQAATDLVLGPVYASGQQW